MNILQDMVRRHLTVPHRFLCFTDDPSAVRCQTRPISHDLPTWWGKLSLFDHPVPGRILYFDPDTVIVGNIDGPCRLLAGPAARSGRLVQGRLRLRPAARVVCFHGRPDPHDVEAAWVSEHWRAEQDTNDEPYVSSRPAPDD